MNNIIQGVLLALSLFASTVVAETMVNVQSLHSVSQTVDKLESILKAKSMKIFNRIKHSDGAKDVGVELRDTELILFGNPKIGSQLMKCQQSIAIDLPQKALVWEDENNKVWLSYNDPMYLAQRHNVKGCDDVFKNISKTLANFAQAAVEE